MKLATIFIFANFVFMSNSWACLDMGIMSAESKTQAIYKYLRGQQELYSNLFLTVHQIKLNTDDTAEIIFIENNDTSNLIFKKLKIESFDDCSHKAEEFE